MAPASAKPSPLAPAFVRSVNAIFETSFKPNMTNAVALWKDACARDSSFASKFARDPTANNRVVRHIVKQCQPQLVERTGNYSDGNAASGGKGGKGNSKGNGKNGKDNAKGKGKGSSDMHFEDYALPEGIFRSHDGNVTLDYIQHQELHAGSNGVAQTNIGNATRLLEAFFKAPLFSNPCAILTAATTVEQLFADYPEIKTRFDAKVITVPVKRGQIAGPRFTDALLLQLGERSVEYRDPTVTIQLDQDEGLTKVWLYVRKSSPPPGVFDKLTTQCNDYFLTALGQLNFDTTKGKFRSEVHWAGEDTLELRAIVFSRKDNKATAYARTGTNGVYLRTVEKDTNTVPANLPIGTTLAEGFALQKKLGAGIGLGLVSTPKGFGIRCLPNQRTNVEAAARPKEALTYGDLFALDKDTGFQFMIRGVDSSVEGPALHNTIRRHLDCKIRPVRPYWAHGKNDWLVLARGKEMPGSAFVCVTTTAGQLMHLEIEQVILNKKQPPWDKLAEAIKEDKPLDYILHNNGWRDYSDNNDANDNAQDNQWQQAPDQGHPWNHQQQAWPQPDWPQTNTSNDTIWQGAGQRGNWHDMTYGDDDQMGLRQAQDAPLPDGAFFNDGDLDTDGDDEEADANAAQANQGAATGNADATHHNDGLNDLLNSLPATVHTASLTAVAPVAPPDSDSQQCTHLSGRAQFDSMARNANVVPNLATPTGPPIAHGTPPPFPCSNGELSGSLDTEWGHRQIASGPGTTKC